MAKLALSKIDYHLDNPRFKKGKETSREALLALFNQDTIELARDIAKNGLNPSKKLIVVKEGSKYITQEGNRRLAAMKILTNHALMDSIPDLSKAIKTELKKAPLELNQSLRSIDCAVATSEQGAAKWVRLEHTGKNSGVGTSQWSREEQKKFDAKYFQEPSIVLQAVELMRRLFANDPAISQLLVNPSLTPLERLLTDPNVRSFLGLTIDNKTLYCTLPEAELKKALKKIIVDITHPESEKRVTTRTLNSKDDRQNYLDQFLQSDIPNQRKTQPAWKATEPDANAKGHQSAAAKTTPAPKTRSAPPTEERKKLLNPGCILRITANSRINDLYHNLRDLDVDRYANAVSILARVFVEMSINHYLRVTLNKTEAELKDTKFSLQSKISKTIEDLHSKSKLTQNQLQSIGRELGRSESGFHPNSLNAFVHNPDLTPSALELKRGWNNIEPLIMAIWA
jgi:hypothetical protein